MLCFALILELTWNEPSEEELQWVPTVSDNINNVISTECPVTMDIAFLLDVSESMSVKDLAATKTFVKDVTSHFTLSNSGTLTLSVEIWDSSACPQKLQ